MGKFLKTTSFAFLILLLSVGCKDHKEGKDIEKTTARQPQGQNGETRVTSDQQFADETIGTLWEDYLQLRSALVQSDANEAKASASQLSENLASGYDGLRNLALQIAEADNLEEQRQLFSELGQQAEPVFKEGLKQGTVYKQFCPMAFQNTGAYWYSDVAEIRNPYFGDRMLKCGKVTERIESRS